MDESRYIIDPALRDFLPKVKGADCDDLESLIKENGCHPLTIWTETRKVVDGHRRHDICVKLGIVPPICELSLPSLDAAHLWMWRNQASRRNLTPGQRAAGVLALKGPLAEEAKKRSLENLSKKPPKNDMPPEGENSATSTKTRDVLATEAEVSTDTIRKTEAVMASGNTKVMDAVKAGTMTVNAAVKAIAPPPPKIKTIQDSADPPNTLNDEHPLYDVFNQHHLFQGLLNQLTAFKKDLHQITGDGKPGSIAAPWGVVMARVLQSMETDIKNLRAAVSQSEPYALCPYPSVNKQHKDCTGCNGRGWVCEGTYKQSPRDYRKGN